MGLTQLKQYAVRQFRDLGAALGSASGGLAVDHFLQNSSASFSFWPAATALVAWTAGFFPR